MSFVMERLCCLGWWARKHKATPGAESDDDDDILIEAIDLPMRRPAAAARSWFRMLPDRRRVHQTPSDAETGIAIVSHGRIKYVKDGSLPAHVAVPIIDPLIGRASPDAKQAAGHQRQLFPQLFPRRLAARRGIFHFHNRETHRQHHHHQQQQQHQHQYHQQQQQQQQWWDSSTPPSSVDLEWEHEGLMAPEEAAADNEASECQSEDDDVEAAIDGPIALEHRSPSPATSACHSLEWDSNCDDFVSHQQAPGTVHRPPPPLPPPQASS